MRRRTTGGSGSTWRVCGGGCCCRAASSELVDKGPYGESCDRLSFRESSDHPRIPPRNQPKLFVNSLPTPGIGGPFWSGDCRQAMREFFCRLRAGRCAGRGINTEGIPTTVRTRARRLPRYGETLIKGARSPSLSVLPVGWSRDRILSTSGEY